MLKIRLFEDRYIEDLLVLYNQLLPKEKLVNSEKVSGVLDKIKKYKDYYIIVGCIDNKVAATCSLIVLQDEKKIGKAKVVRPVLTMTEVMKDVRIK